MTRSRKEQSLGSRDGKANANESLKVKVKVKVKDVEEILYWGKCHLNNKYCVLCIVYCVCRSPKFILRKGLGGFPCFCHAQIKSSS